ncbi:hypothetical protein EV421DRAFT_169619 [Armillaria borealis]|uniref:Uncharacterized protein n=1 Tax=Armillaria borealis TaxID=47425 RepID=A0AA39IYE8_9AGAR|nr:hypothetical protein EV421DRAFT_169619 [Armillaria borealis]
MVYLRVAMAPYQRRWVCLGGEHHHPTTCICHQSWLISRFPATMCHVIISSGYPRLRVSHRIAITLSILVYFPNDYPPVAIALSVADSGIFSFEEILSNIRMQPAGSWTSLFVCSVFPFSNNGQLRCRPNLTDFPPLSEWRFTPSVTEYPFEV